MQAVLTKSRLQLGRFTSAIESCEENLTDECDDLINSESFRRTLPGLRGRLEDTIIV